MLVELAAICRMHGPAYRANGPDPLWPSHGQAMQAIEPDRTAALGGHVSCWEHCQDAQSRSHACTHRHGPTCLHGAAHAWRPRPRARLRPVPYGLVPCTGPDALRELARSPHKRLDHTRFRAAAAALHKLAREPRVVGGPIGMSGVWHTWTRALHSHPPGHYLGPAGGGARAGRPGRPSRDDFLGPVKALALVCRATFRAALRQTPVFDGVPREGWARDWVVPCAPVGTGAHALQ